MDGDSARLGKQAHAGRHRDRDPFGEQTVGCVDDIEPQLLVAAQRGPRQPAQVSGSDDLLGVQLVLPAVDVHGNRVGMAGGGW
ncbi:hypothetical protein AU194_08195 [Mycobacterium sp. GA-2829]|nr:hypothetical protein AU194_08195 [Mycobacterium sp. GA-2829]